jgi:hypothetical protein
MSGNVTREMKNFLVRQPNDMIDRLSINTASFLYSPSGMRNCISVAVQGKNRASNAETRKEIRILF